MTLRHFIRPGLHGAAPKTMMSPMNGSQTLSLSERRPPAVWKARFPIGLRPKFTGWGGSGSSGRPMRVRALLIATKWACPVRE